MRTLILLLHNLGPFRRRFYLLALVGFLDGVATFAIPLALARATSQRFSSAEAGTLALLLASLYAISLCLQWVLRAFAESLAPEFSLHTRLRYFRAMEALPPSKLAELHSGYLLTLTAKVSDGLSGVIIDILWGLSRSIAQIALFFWVTANESLGLALLNLVVLALFVTASRALSQKMVPLADRLNQDRARMLAAYADFCSAMLTVKRLGIREFCETRLESLSGITVAQQRRLSAFHAMRWLILHSVFSAAIVATIYYLLVSIAHGQSSVAMLILFVSAFSIIKLNADRLSESFRTLLEMNAHVNTLSEIVTLSASPLPQQRRRWETLALRDVRFQHPGSSITISAPHFELRRGERVFLSGESGAGKTTILNLLAGWLAPHHGEVTLDGQQVLSNDMSQLQTIALVGQDGELFNLSVRENLTLGSAVSEDLLLEMIDALRLSPWLASLRNGLDSIIGERGATVSQGQKQRLMLLRAAILDRDTYLLDEPTSHLDEQSAAGVEGFIKRYMGGKTLVIASHRASLAALCERALQIRNHLLER